MRYTISITDHQAGGQKPPTYVETNHFLLAAAVDGSMEALAVGEAGAEVTTSEGLFDDYEAPHQVIMALVFANFINSVEAHDGLFLWQHLIPMSGALVEIIPTEHQETPR